MKVAIVLASDFVEGNGSNSRIKAFAKGLKSEGVDVELLFLHASSFNNSGINDKISGYWNGIFFKFLNGKCIRPENFSGRFLDTLKGIFASTFFLLKNHKKYHVFYLYGPTIYQFLQVYILRWLLGINVIIERTELRSALFEGKKGWKSKLQKYIHKIDERFSNHFCDHLFVISSFLMKHYQNYLPKEKISLLPIVVDFSRFKKLKNNTSPEFRIGYLGSCGEKDGVDGIINAFLLARKEMPELKLRLIGFDRLNRINKNPQTQFLNGSLEQMGQVLHDDIPRLLGECDLLVVNRLGSKYASYGFPTKLGEYLATGNPTVVTRVGDIEKYFHDRRNVIMVEPENDQQLADIFIDRFRNSDLFNKIGVNGRKTCFQLFNYRKHLPMMLKVFRSVISKNA